MHEQELRVGLSYVHPSDVGLGTRLEPGLHVSAELGRTNRPTLFEVFV